MFSILTKFKTGKTISDKFEDIDFSLSLNNDAHKQVLSVAKLQIKYINIIINHYTTSNNRFQYIYIINNVNLFYERLINK